VVRALRVMCVCRAKKNKKMKRIEGEGSSAALNTPTHTHTHTHLSDQQAQPHTILNPNPKHLTISKCFKQHVIQVINMLNMEINHKPNMV
jgi:hypothetical protein